MRKLRLSSLSRRQEDIPEGAETSKAGTTKTKSSGKNEDVLKEERKKLRAQIISQENSIK